MLEIDIEIDKIPPDFKIVEIIQDFFKKSIVK